MREQKVDMYLFSNAKYFPAQSIPYLKDRLLAADDSKDLLIQSTELKDPTLIFIVSLFLGSFGIDRFLLGDIGLGILKLMTGGIFGILTIIDWVIIMKRTREENLDKLLSVL